MFTDCSIFIDDAFTATIDAVKAVVDVKACNGVAAAVKSVLPSSLELDGGIAVDAAKEKCLTKAEPTPNTPNNGTVCTAICGKGEEYFQDVEIFLKQLQTDLTKFVNFTNSTILVDVTELNNKVVIANTTVADLLKAADANVDLRKVRLAMATQAVKDLEEVESEDEEKAAVDAAKVEADEAAKATDAATEASESAAEATDATAAATASATATAADAAEASETATAVGLDVAAGVELGLNPIADAAAGIVDGLSAAATAADIAANAAEAAADGVEAAAATAETTATAAEEAEESAEATAKAAEDFADGEVTNIETELLPKAIEYEAKCAKALDAAEQHQSEIKKAAGLTAKVAKATGFLVKIVNFILDYAKKFNEFGVKLLEVINVGDDADKDYCVACGNGDFIYAIITDGVNELVRTFAGKFAQAFLG